MEEIKQHLLKGNTVKEIVEMGYKKPSIYKVKKTLKEIVKESDSKSDDEPDREPDLKPPAEPDHEPDPDPPVEPDHEPDSKTGAELDHELVLEGGEDKPFREYEDISINRDNIDIVPNFNVENENVKPIITSKTGTIGVTELIAQVYGIAGIITGHDHWELTTKEQKITKHLCKVPGLEKFLHQFGLYGCVLSLITITFSKIKQEIKLNKENKENTNESVHQTNTTIRPDSPSNIMGNLNAV